MTKCAIFVLISENYYHKIKNYSLIEYEELISNPNKSIKRLTKKLDLQMTKNTLKILKTVKKSSKKININLIKDQIDPEILKKLKKYEKRN